MTLTPTTRTLDASPAAARAALRQVLLVLGGSAVVALCARFTVPLPFTPVPLTLQNFGVLLVGLALGPRLGFAALALYLAEGAAGLPVFNPTGPGGLLQLLGPTGGYLMAYPLVAGIAGFAAQVGRRKFWVSAVGCTVAEAVLFAAGVAWFGAVTHLPLSQAVHMALLPFIFGEIAKIAAASAAAPRLGGMLQTQ